MLRLGTLDCSGPVVGLSSSAGGSLLLASGLGTIVIVCGRAHTKTRDSRVLVSRRSRIGAPYFSTLCVGVIQLRRKVCLSCYLRLRGFRLGCGLLLRHHPVARRFTVWESFAGLLMDGGLMMAIRMGGIDRRPGSDRYRDRERNTLDTGWHVDDQVDRHCRNVLDVNEMYGGVSRRSVWKESCFL